MEEFVTFHKSCRGHLHIAKDTVCQDYSMSYQDELCKIIVVADGHGAAACCRSDFGSRTVGEIAITQLKQFAEDMSKIWAESPDGAALEEFLNPKHQQRRIRTLTDSITAKWNQVILENLKNYPLTEEECSKAEDFSTQYRSGERLSHLFGTTLIAALWLEPVLILIQQGDGRCNIFYQDQTIAQPIPWDDRCHMNVTSSMCDEDTTTSIRSHVIDLREKPVIACFLGSDGVEDSYRTMEGNYIFYKELILSAQENGFTDIEQQLESSLPAFSKNGSGDDVSVAGIIIKNAFSTLTAQYRKDIDIYKLQENLSALKGKTNSMTRKHSILEERAGNSPEASAEFSAYDAEYNSYIQQQKILEDQINTLQKG